MKSITQLFHQTCKNRYKQFNFSKCAQTYARINNDVVHAFTLKKSRILSETTIDFGVFPLCTTAPIYLESGGYELYKFTSETYFSHYKSFYCRSHNLTAEDVITTLIEMIDTYLIPFFNNCSGCETALKELLNLEALFEKNRQLVLLKHCEVDCAEPWQTRSLFDDRKYYMALKSKDYAYADKYLKHQVEHCSSKLNEFYNAIGNKQPDIVIQRYVDRLNLFADHLSKLKNGNIRFFDDLVYSNEKQMHKYLSDNYPQLF